MAVIRTLDLADDVTARDAPRQADGVHRRLGPGVGEPDALEPESSAQLFGQRHRRFGGHRELGAGPGRALDGGHDARVGVARRGRTEAVVEVEVVPAVDVPHLGSAAAREVDGIGVRRLERRRHAEGQRLESPLEEPARRGRGLEEGGVLRGEQLAGPCPQSFVVGAGSLRAGGVGAGVVPWGWVLLAAPSAPAPAGRPGLPYESAAVVPIMQRDCLSAAISSANMLAARRGRGQLTTTTADSGELGSSPTGEPAGGKGLKTGALGMISSLVIGVASTAPAYSLAATLGFVAAIVGLQSPSVMLLAFVPMLFIAAAYYYLNRADPDCGTTFTWVTRAMGPKTGWLAGWGILMTDLVVMPNLASIAGVYTFDVVRRPRHRRRQLGVLGHLRRGHLDRRHDRHLLHRHRVVGPAPRWRCSAPRSSSSSSSPSWRWSRCTPATWPTASARRSNGSIRSRSRPIGALSAGMLLAVFIYWGWDTAVTVNEEAKDTRRTPGRAALWSTIVLVLIYVVVSVAAQAFKGARVPHQQQQHRRRAQRPGDGGVRLSVEQAADHLRAHLGVVVDPDHDPAGGPFVAVDGRAQGVAQALRRHPPQVPVTGVLHARCSGPSPSSGTWRSTLISPNDVLANSIEALGFGIAFYYGLTGFACVIYYRRHIFKSFKNFIFIGLAPFARCASSSPCSSWWRSSTTPTRSTPPREPGVVPGHSTSASHSSTSTST